MGLSSEAQQACNCSPRKTEVRGAGSKSNTQITAKNFPKAMKEASPRIQEVQFIQNSVNTKKTAF